MAGTATVGTMEQSWADQYNCSAVLLTGPCDPDEVIAFAREIGAECSWECEPDEPADLVIDFDYFNRARGRAVGPEVFTEEAVRSQLAREMDELSSSASPQ